MKHKTLVIVPCTKTKIWQKQNTFRRVQAQFVYTGTPYNLNCQFAKRFGDQWCILSAKYGFLHPEDEIEGPYDVTFLDPNTHPIEIDKLKYQVRQMSLNTFGEVIVLGGRIYEERTRDAFRGTPCSLLFPFTGLRFGDRQGAIKKAIQSGKVPK